jgi:uncharacterized membrane protein YccF (DUF307 family)
MTLLLNLAWLTIGGGFVAALEYFLAGLLLCLTVVGIPFGVQAFKLGRMLVSPFGTDFRDDPDAAGGGVLGLVMNIVWFVGPGLVIAATHLGLALVLTLTIVGIPFALQHAKFAVLALFPFGKRLVDAG